AAQLERYTRTFHNYLERLRSAGVPILETELQPLDREAPPFVAYCTQPAFESSALLTDRLARMDSAAARAPFARVVDVVVRAISRRLGLDAECTNWALLDGAPVYIDTSTPLMRDAEGREEVDVEIFLASVPAILRPFVRRFMVRGILDSFFDRRAVLLHT